MNTSWRARMALAVCSFGFAIVHVHAVPANPAVVVIEQPDGTKLEIVMRGDEYQGWMETIDGYTIVRRGAKGFFEYAATREGRLVPSGVIAAPPGIATMELGSRIEPAKGIRPARNVELERSQEEWIRSLRASRRRALEAKSGGARAPAGQQVPEVTGTWAPVPVSGPKPLLVILVNFNDIEVKTGAAAHWSDALFRAGGRSVADFYRDNSYGKVTVIAVPHTQAGSPPGVVTISLPQKHPDYGNRGTYAAESEWVNKALAAAAAHVDFARLDTNADGTIEVDEALVYFILAGHEMSGGSGLRPWIWAHRWGGPGVGVGGKKIDNWALNGEMYNATERMQIGVIAHEVGHAMGGLPDLYDISNTNAGLGGFSVMSSGSWGSRPGETQGATPVGMDAWSRQYLGWSAPRYPAASGSITFTSAFSGSNSAVMLMNPAISTSEYWLVENRAPVGWDAGLSRWLGSWKGGLLVQHVDTMIGTQHANSFNKYVARSHQGNVAVEPSTAKCRMLKPKGSAGCETILFFSGNAILFDGTSTPGSKFYSGKASALGVSNVSVPGPSMTATITR